VVRVVHTRVVHVVRVVKGSVSIPAGGVSQFFSGGLERNCVNKPRQEKGVKGGGWRAHGEDAAANFSMLDRLEQLLASWSAVAPTAPKGAPFTSCVH